MVPQECVHTKSQNCSSTDVLTVSPPLTSNFDASEYYTYPDKFWLNKRTNARYSTFYNAINLRYYCQNASVYMYNESHSAAPLLNSIENKCQWWDHEWSVKSVPYADCKSVRCEVTPPAAAGFAPAVSVRTGEFDMLVGLPEDTRGYFYCADLGRFADDYDKFSVRVFCGMNGTDPEPYDVPDTWPTCKTS